MKRHNNSNYSYFINDTINYPNNQLIKSLKKSEIVFAIKNLKSWVKISRADTPFLLSTAKCYIKPESYGLDLIFSAWK